MCKTFKEWWRYWFGATESEEGEKNEEKNKKNNWLAVFWDRVRDVHIRGYIVAGGVDGEFGHRYIDNFDNFSS